MQAFGGRLPEMREVWRKTGFCGGRAKASARGKLYEDRYDHTNVTPGSVTGQKSPHVCLERNLLNQSIIEI